MLIFTNLARLATVMLTSVSNKDLLLCRLSTNLSSSLACQNSYPVHHNFSNSLLFSIAIFHQNPPKNFYRLENHSKLIFFLPPLFQTIMDKSRGTLVFLGVFQLTQAQPLPSAHNLFWTRVSRIFSEFQLCIGWGEGELRENFEKDVLFYEGIRNDRKIRILHYCLKYFCP